MKKKLVVMVLACSMLLGACGSNKEAENKSSSTGAIKNTLVAESEVETKPVEAGEAAETESTTETATATGEEESTEIIFEADTEMQRIAEEVFEAEEKEYPGNLTAIDYEKVTEAYGFNLNGEDYRFPMYLAEVVTNNKDWEYTVGTIDETHEMVSPLDYYVPVGESEYFQATDKDGHVIEMFVKNKDKESEQLGINCRLYEISFERDPYNTDEDYKPLSVTDIEGIGFESTKDDIVELLGEPSEIFEDANTLLYYTYAESDKEQPEDLRFVIAKKIYMLDDEDKVWCINMQYLGE